MSAISSLSLWSSIKIPLSMYASKRKRESDLSLPCVDSCDKIKQKNKAGLDRKMTSFRVSNPLGKGKENSIPEFAFIRPDTKDTSRKKISPKTSSKTPPTDGKDSGNFYTNALYKKPSRRSSFENLAQEYIDLEEKCLELNIEDDGGEEICIPPIKPWTLEELHELNEKYKMMEEEVKMEAERKKSKREEITKENERRNEKKASNKSNRTFRLKANTSRKSLNQKRNYNSDFDETHLNVCDVTHSESDSFSDQELIISDYSKKHSRRKTKPANESYYETKLAELYTLDCGIKANPKVGGGHQLNFHFFFDLSNEENARQWCN